MLIGGWQRDFFAILPAARALAVAMAETHLSSGEDVVLPQLVTSADEARRFEDAAARAGAGYVEVALLVDLTEQSRRFRSKAEVDIVDAHVKAAVYSLLMFFLAAGWGMVISRRVGERVADHPAVS